MVTRGDLIWMGVAAGVSGGLIGGLLIAVGLALLLKHTLLGFLVVLPAAPIACLPGYVMARRLADQLP